MTCVGCRSNFITTYASLLTGELRADLCDFLGGWVGEWGWGGGITILLGGPTVYICIYKKFSCANQAITCPNHHVLHTNVTCKTFHQMPGIRVLFIQITRLFVIKVIKLNNADSKSTSWYFRQKKMIVSLHWYKFFQHVQVWTKWPPCCRRHFQIDLIVNQYWFR